MRALALISALALAAPFFFGGCASAPTVMLASDLSERERLLIGTWTADIDFARWVVIRRADRTFSKRAIRIYDYAKPAIRVETEGTWRIEGDQYCDRTISSTSVKWKPPDTREKIRDLSATKLEYLPYDSPLIIERKLEPAEASALMRKPLTLSTRPDHPVEPAQ